jgi:hypothetical protein
MSNFTSHVPVPGVRQTITSGPMKLGRKWGNRLRPSGRATQTASFRVNVAANVMSPGEVVLRIGDHTLISGVDFVPVAGNSNDTATAMAAAIAAIEGFTATANAADVSVVWTGFAERRKFEVSQRGDVSHVTLISPADGLMAFGAVGPAAPQLG